MLFRLFLVTITLLLAASPSLADNEEKVYISLSGNLNLAADMELRSQNGALNATLNQNDSVIENDAGVGFSHSVGYKFESGFRADMEFAFREVNPNEGTSETSGGTTTIDGDYTVKSLLANMSYDFDWGDGFQPYVGYGAGIAWQEVDFEKFDGANSGVSKQSDTNFAYQLLLGVHMPVWDNMDLALGYRYFGTADPDLKNFETEVDIHSLEIGIRYYFE